MLTHVLTPLQSFLGSSPDENVVIPCYAYVSGSTKLLVAVYIESTNQLTVGWSSECSATLEWVSLQLDPVCSITISPCAKYIACLLANGSLKLVETPFKHECRAADEPTYSRAFITSSRNFVIYSNKGGEIFFIDVHLRKPTISLQAPQSIHALQLVTELSQNMASNNVYLLATGFTSSQWLIPLETGGLSLRETLSNVIPSDLVEIASTGHVMPLTWRGSNCIAVFRKLTALVELFHCVNMRNAIISVNLPINTVSVLVTDDTIFTVDEDSNVTAQHILSNINSNQVLENKPIGRFEGQLLDLIPIKYDMPLFGAINYPLCSAFLLGASGLVLLRSIKSKIDIFISMIESSKEENISEIAIALCLDLQKVSFQIASMLLSKPTPNLNLTIKICKKARMAPVDVINLFSSFKYTNYVLTSYQSVFDTIKQEITQSDTKVVHDDNAKLICAVVDVVAKAEGYEQTLCNYWLRSLIQSLPPYLTESLLEKLVDSKMWACARVHLNISKLNEFVARRILIMPDVFYDNDQFFQFCLLPSFTNLISKNIPLALDYFDKIHTHLHKFESKKLVLDLLSLTNPMRGEITILLNKHKKRQLVEQEVLLLRRVASIFLPTLVKLIGEYEKPSSKKRPKMLGASNFHACLVSADALFCWGRSREVQCFCSVPNTTVQIQLGQMKVASSGRTSQNTNSGPAFTLPIIVPLPICPSSVTHISCGSEHTVLQTEHGVLYSWGFNSYGQCGIGHEDPVLTPQKIHALHLPISCISTGSFHSAAVDVRGNVYSWGWGVHGQLGLGSIQSDPMQPKRLEHFTEPVQSVYCGYAHTLLVTQTGKVYVCGNGTYGQTGIGNPQKQRVPIMVPLDTDSPVILAACGRFHCLVLTAANQLFTWGSTPQALKFKAMLQKRKNKGETLTSPTSSTMAMSTEGVGSIEGNHLKPTTVDLTSLSQNGCQKVVEMSCGLQHSALLTDKGNLYMWGKNLECQLGLGDKKERSVPTLIGGPKGSNWFQVQCGSDYTLALTGDGQLFAWGRNDISQLGFRSITDNEKHWASGKTFTFQKGNKGQRTIQLPQDSRVFVQKPTLVPGLQSLVSPQASNNTIASQFDYDYLIKSFKVYHAFYELEQAIGWCASHDALHNLTAFIYFIHDRFKDGIDAYSKHGLVDFESQKTWYTSLLDNLAFGNLSQFCNGLDALRIVCKLSNEQFGGYVSENLSKWMNGLVFAMSSQHSIVNHVTPITKLQILKLSSTKTTSINNEEIKRKIDLSQVTKEDQVLYLFSECGHNLSQSAFIKQINLVDSDIKLENKFCQFFDNDLSNYPGRVCPDCVKTKFISSIN